MTHNYFFGYSKVSKEKWERAFGKTVEPEFVICTEGQRETDEMIIDSTVGIGWYTVAKENDTVSVLKGVDLCKVREMFRRFGITTKEISKRLSHK